jgi:regulator of protease activity HflC (stomatin/prohibitin superfamily)
VDPTGTAPPRLADTIASAWLAYEELIALGEEIDDEWSYVNDLAEAWRARVVEVEQARGRETARPEVAAAVAALIAEAAAIDDANRAIDWLSTFPQVLLIALGERP